MCPGRGMAPEIFLPGAHLEVRLLGRQVVLPFQLFLAPAGRLGPRSGAGGLGWALQVTGQPEPGTRPLQVRPRWMFHPTALAPGTVPPPRGGEDVVGGRQGKNRPSGQRSGDRGGDLRPQNGSEHQTDAPGLIYGCSLESRGVCVSVSECEVCVCEMCARVCGSACVCTGTCVEMRV